jgi:hypothetical protein
MPQIARQVLKLLKKHGFMEVRIIDTKINEQEVNPLTRVHVDKHFYYFSRYV